MTDDRRDLRITLDSPYEMHTTIPKALAWLQGLAAQVPPEYADNSTFIVELERDYYGGSSLTFDVYYTRPETDEEMAARHAEYQANAEAARRMNEANERRIYEQLRRKFG